jgi:hypothetical protein
MIRFIPSLLLLITPFITDAQNINILLSSGHTAKAEVKSMEGSIITTVNGVIYYYEEIQFIDIVLEGPYSEVIRKYYKPSPFNTATSEKVSIDWNEGAPQYQKIIDVPNTSIEDLYKSSNKWVITTYKNPEKVITANLPNELIKGSGYESGAIKFASISYGDFKYVFDIEFKPGKVRFTMHDLEIASEAGTYPISKYVYKEDGTPYTNKQAVNVRDSATTVANNLIDSLEKYLLTKQ